MNTRANEAMNHEANEATNHDVIDVEAPVLIVGAGPAGLATALLLSRYGVPNILVERHAGTAHTPRAHIVNQRTVEIFRHMGIEDELLAVGTPQHMMSNNVWATSLAGLEVARLQTWGTAPERAAEYRKASPSPMTNCPQTVLEPVLLHAIQEAGVTDLRFGHEFRRLDQDADGVTAVIEDRDSGTTSIVRCQYLIGADGGRSEVLEQAGLRVDGEAGLSHAANIWFEADLTRFLAHRPGVLYWNTSPGTDFMVGAGTLICQKPWREFVMVIMYDPDRETISDDEDFLIGRVHKVIGDPSVEVTLKGMSMWQINHQVAPIYSAGRVVCMGDAVHRHPPTNGLGLNTSIADAFNLAWKLALVLEGRAGAQLLESYSVERQPVGRAVVDRALASVTDMAAIPAALGFHPDQSEEDGWASLAGLYEPGEEGDRRRAALREAIDVTNYQFNAHGVEVGYRYRDGAIVADGTPEPVSVRDTQLYYDPTTWPGAHLPHVWLERDGHRLSALDLVEGTRFALLTGIGGEGWVDAALEVEQLTGVGIDVHIIGSRNGIIDCYGDWERLRGVGSTGCVLVRPDRHVAWRAQRLDHDPTRLLHEVMQQLLTPAGAPTEELHGLAQR
jgi:2,4-dichlorophenol 6-monooxygenase